MAEEIKKNEKGLYDTSIFKVGSKDPTTNTTIEEIYYHTEDYVIFKANQKLRYYIADENVPKDKQVHRKNLRKVDLELGLVYSLQPEKVKGFGSITNQVARGMRQALAGEIDNAKILLTEARNRLIQLRCLQGRLQYLYIAFCTALLPLVPLLCVKFFNLFPDLPEIGLYLKIMTFGAIGGILSVSLNVWKLEIDLDASRNFNFAAGISRIFIAIAAGIVTYYAIKAKLILGTLQDNDYGTYVAIIVAGFSESFIPNIIRKISKEETEAAISTACKIER